MISGAGRLGREIAAQLVVVVLCAVAARPAGAQADTSRRVAPARDSARTDSSAVQQLVGVHVTVTRTDETAQRAPWAVGVQDKDQISRGQATLGIDEALPNVAGVYVAPRYNYSLDQRLSIRGAGSRANFGIRGVKVLLDGVPQSLPDGQNQLNNIDLGDISRVEVLRGSASSLYGNGSGGVIAMTSDMSSPDPMDETLRMTGGSFGLAKVQSRTSGRIGDAIGALFLSRTTLDGFRQFSNADVKQANAALDYSTGASSGFQFRAMETEMPTALNPGALTPAEYAANRDSAAAVNIARDASKSISQAQYSLRFHDGDASTGAWSAVAYVQRRFVDNPLATSPPGTVAPTVGTYSTIRRWVTGARLDGSRALPWLCGCSDIARAPLVAAGIDFERSYDVRRNWRATGGHPSAPTDTLLVNQDEIVSSLGPFVAVRWSPVEPLTIDGGVRWDDVDFMVKDHFFADGVDNSGARDMTAWSGHVGASWVFSRAFTPYVSYSTAFETPTTTELSAKPDGSGGFKADLGPQTVHTVEGGARGAFGDRLSYTLSIFRAQATGAIIQYLETDGRAFFRNAGETRNDGLELGLAARFASWLDADVAWTEARYRFVSYLVPNGAKTDTLNGKKEAGVPDRYVRVGLRTRRGKATLDADWSWSSSMFADDKNTVRVDDWNHGSLAVRAAWDVNWRDLRLQPFASVNNLFNQPYVGAVTLNGAGNRDLEPAPLRNFYLGTEVGWRVVR